MAKKAFLVTFSTMTRVIVDVADETLEDKEDFNKVVREAREKISLDVADYLTEDNCYEAKLDVECPYDPLVLSELYK